MDSGFDPYFFVFVIGLPLLFLLLTGPGMWSEKWGWGFLARGWRRKRLEPPDRSGQK